MTNKFEPWLALSEQMDPMLDTIVAHRTKLLAKGFNETAAEMMTVQFHDMLMNMISREQKKGDKK